jgi:proteasome lid subunit RPN8/RPN11
MASVTHTLALPNVTDEGPRRRFRVSDRDYLQCEKRATELGGELLGFYHSHPDHPAQAVAIRSRSRVAVLLVHHRCRPRGAPRT